MARHKNPQLSLENLQDLEAEYKSFSQIVVGLVSLFAGAVALMLHLSGHQTTGIELLFLAIAPVWVAVALQLGRYFGISRRISKLNRGIAA